MKREDILGFVDFGARGAALGASLFVAGEAWFREVLTLPQALAWGAGLSAVSFAGAAVAGRAMRTYADLIFPAREPDPGEVEYQLPAWPEGPDLQVILGEDHDRPGGFCERPRWYTLPALGLFTGVAVLGATGAAKTAGVGLPVLRQFFEHAAADPARRCAGLIMDYKASLVRPARELAQQHGREADLILIGPDHPIRWNPIHAPELEPRVLAARVLAVLENLSGQSHAGDSSWVAENAGRIIENALGIIRITQGYVTLADIHAFLQELERALAGDAEQEKSPAQLMDEYLAGWHALLPEDLDSASRTQFQHHCAYFGREYIANDRKFRGIYLSEIARITQYFADPRYREQFSPRREDINFPGFRAAIDRGLIVVLDATAERFGPLANALGIFAKLEFQRAALARPDERRRNPAYNFERPLVFFCDEYQEFVSTGQQGDDQFFALCRESKTANFVMTQSRSSLVSKLGEIKTQVVLASLRSKVFLALSEPQDRQYAAQICGEDWGFVENVSASESIEAANLTAGGQFLGRQTTVAESRNLSRQKLNRFEPTTFRDLPTFSAVVSGFDGRQALPPKLIYLKPFFRARDERYRDFIQEFGRADT